MWETGQNLTFEFNKCSLCESLFEEENGRLVHVRQRWGVDLEPPRVVCGSHRPATPGQTNPAAVNHCLFVQTDRQKAFVLKELHVDQSCVLELSCRKQNHHVFGKMTIKFVVLSSVLLSILYIERHAEVLINNIFI